MSGISRDQIVETFVNPEAEVEAELASNLVSYNQPLFASLAGSQYYAFTFYVKNTIYLTRCTFITKQASFPNQLAEPDEHYTQ